MVRSPRLMCDDTAAVPLLRTIPPDAIRKALAARADELSRARVAAATEAERLQTVAEGRPARETAARRRAAAETAATDAAVAAAAAEDAERAVESARARVASLADDEQARAALLV